MGQQQSSVIVDGSAYNSPAVRSPRHRVLHSASANNSPTAQRARKGSAPTPVRATPKVAPLDLSALKENGATASTPFPEVKVRERCE